MSNDHLSRTLWIAAAAALASSAGACKWTEFDDLAQTTWVHSTSKPGVNSTDYGLELRQVQHAGDGAKLAVIGSNEPSFSTLVYDTKGNTTLGPAPVDLNKEFTINSIPDAPALVADPSSDNVAFVIPSTENRTVVLSGAADALVELTINDPKPSSAVYLPGPSGTASTLLVSGTGNFHGIAGSTANTCVAADDLAAPLQAIVMAPLGANVLVWNDQGKLLQYDAATVVASNDGPSAVAVSPIGAAIDLGFKPGARSKLIPLGGTLVLVVGIAPLIGGDGMAGVYDLATGMPAGSPAVQPATYQGLRSAAFGTVLGTPYLALGFPTRPVQNIAAGQVEVHEVDIVGGSVSDSIDLALSDDQPENNQSFGQAIEIMHFNDDDIFVVAADNEIFSYYETTKYPDARK